MNKILLIMLLILFLPVIANSYDYVRYVDTGSAGGDGTQDRNDGEFAAYAALQDGETAMDGVVGAGESIVFYCKRTGGGGVDSTQAVWGTEWDDTAEITIIATDFPDDGIFDDTKYVFSATDAKNFYQRTQIMTLKNMQFISTVSGVGVGSCLSIDQQTAGAVMMIDSCIFVGVSSGSGENKGIKINDADLTVTLINSIVYGFKSTGGDAGDAGFMAVNCALGTLNAYNNTIFDSYYGLRGGGTLNCYNNVLFENTDDTSAETIFSWNATDQGAGEDDAANGLDINLTWDTTCFTDPELSPPEVLVQDVDSPIYLYSEITYDDNNLVPQVDITGRARNTGAGQNTSVGAFELDAGGNVVPIIVNIQNQ